MTNKSGFSEASRVWIYQSDRAFSEEETKELNQELADFAAKWTSHQQQLRAHGAVLYQRFLVLMVDDVMGSGASGCSIDSSVRFMQDVAAKYKVDLFDRLNFAYLQNEEVKVVRKEDLSEKVQAGEINEDTLFFDNLVKTKAGLSDKWLVPLKDSWHRRFVKV